jgi:mRNA-degrading endonuclease RelE of RelBE toxin-antitoxin system
MPRYQLRYAPAYLDDLRFLVSAYDLPIIVAAVLFLEDQADFVTRNRCPLKAPFSWCPNATWQLKVGGYRVLYRIEDGIVEMLRVLFKGSKTTEEMGP